MEVQEVLGILGGTTSKEQSQPITQSRMYSDEHGLRYFTLKDNSEIEVLDSLHNTYVENYDKFINRDFKNKKSTVYGGVLICPSGDVACSFNTHYSKIPSIDELKEYIELIRDDPATNPIENAGDLTGSLLTAANSLIKNVSEGKTRVIISSEDMIIKHYPVDVDSLTYDFMLSSKGNQEEIDELVNNFMPVFKKYERQLKLFGTVKAIDNVILDPLTLELYEHFNIGFNDKKFVKRAIGFQKDIENYTIKGSFLTKLEESYEERVNIAIDMLKQYNRMFPSIDTTELESVLRDKTRDIVEEKTKKYTFITNSNTIINATKTVSEEKTKTISCLASDPLFLENINEKKLLLELVSNLKENRSNGFIKFTYIDIKNIIRSNLEQVFMTTKDDFIKSQIESTLSNFDNN